MNAKDLTYDKIKLGDSVDFSETVTAKKVDLFAELSGDTNPLHTDAAYAKTTKFGKRVVHGMLLASFFSRLVGMYLPGKRCLYLGQDIKFMKPVFVDEKITIHGEVSHKSDANQVIQLRTWITNDQGEEVVTGSAQATMLEDEKKKSSKGSSMTFKDKVVLVTGGSRGIGAAIAKAFGSAGAIVCINYHKNKDAATKVLKEITSAGGQGNIFQADVSDPKTVDTMINSIMKEFKKIDIVINNATAPLNIKSVVALTWDDYQKDIDTLVKGAFLVSKASLKGMLERKFGRIINIITSAVHDAPPPNWSTYVTAKSALVGLSKSLAVEVGPYGITVNMVSPGLTETDLTSFMSQNVKMAVVSHTTKKRLGTPEDIAEAVLFLAGDGAEYINGIDLSVTGGASM